ncbi:succinyl-diaminopimelate desuccinylase [Holosporaceae bacterium 'Namur']|nr:succinyl-diaminopimelate desuccinylase [Holosporaceae bacterium 'Namur']
MQLIPLLQKLIACKSVTPMDDGAIDLIYQVLKEHGFNCEIMTFRGNGSYEVKNLYARFGFSSPHICFAGHTDVVPTGDISNWRFDPFTGIIDEGIIYGRGVVDMKGAVAAMISAACEFVKADQFSGSISFLITGDEEAEGINGTKQVLNQLSKMGEKFDACIVGEPTSTINFADTIKVGRRGSITFYLKIKGVQGHVAYPHNADNPINYIIKILNAVKIYNLDQGNEFFDPSNLEITSIDVGNSADNVIPALASATFNIRFNNNHTSARLINLIKSVCDDIALEKYELKYRISGEAFITESAELINVLQESITQIAGKQAELSTSGGTSDARFIKDYCPVIEFGLLNSTAHKVDECSLVEHIEKLEKIYCRFLIEFFK